ncbi:MAG: hypothetical protein COA74_07695 [Gammaproteobacteria bacterium]|nr:MAG: hypothetical protein COA74_07695 [Gammaproteobacteria bacterium]
MKNISKIFIVIAFLFSSQLFASELSSAKDSGLIGEQANGYIGFVTSVSGDIKSLVKSVNAKRKARYMEIAKGKKLPLSEVTKIGGAQTIAKTKRGNYIMRTGEGWTKK